MPDPIAINQKTVGQIHGMKTSVSNNLKLHALTLFQLVESGVDDLICRRVVHLFLKGKDRRVLSDFLEEALDRRRNNEHDNHV